MYWVRTGYWNSPVSRPTAPKPSPAQQPLADPLAGNNAARLTMGTGCMVDAPLTSQPFQWLFWWLLVLDFRAVDCNILQSRTYCNCMSINGLFTILRQRPTQSKHPESGLKIRRPQGRGGSSPPPGTKRTHVNDGSCAISEPLRLDGLS